MKPSQPPAAQTPTDRAGRTELHYAANDGDLAAVQALLSAGADVNLQDKRGWAPLHFAAQANSEAVTSCLLAHGALVELADSFGNTPLSTATFASKGNGTVIRLLRAAGADPTKTNKSGVSPVSLARTIANYDVAQFFTDVTIPPPPATVTPAAGTSTSQLPPGSQQ